MVSCSAYFAAEPWRLWVKELLAVIEHRGG